VANQHPTRRADYRICVVGECPSYDDVASAHPFSGQPGKFLDQVLANAGILRDACLLANIVQECPNKQGELSRLPRSSGFYAAGSAALATDLATFSPNVCLLLGRAALFAALGTMDLDGWKCSFFIGTRGPFEGRKCIATFRPQEALKLYAEHTPWITFAAHKAKAEGHRPNLVVPQRVLKTNPTYEELLADLDKVIATKCKVSLDIEGSVGSLSCCSVATSPFYSFIVPLARLDGDNWWAEEWQEVEIWKRFVAIWSDPEIPKVFQNFLYDGFVMQQGYDVVTKGLADDTMLAWWELYAELEKNLGAQVSIMTEQTAYKWMGRQAIRDGTGDQDQFFRYCCLDSAVTFEISEKIPKYLNQGQLAHYRRNVELLSPLLYMQLRGIRYDHQLAKQRLTSIQDHVYSYQSKLNAIATEHKALVGLSFHEGNNAVLASARACMCNKVKARSRTVRKELKPKRFKKYGGRFLEVTKEWTIPGEWVPNDAYIDAYPKWAGRLEQSEPLTDNEKGHLSMLLGESMNTKSPKFKSFLYETLKLPTQYKRDPKTKEMRPTTDYLSLLKLSKKHPHAALSVALELSRLRTRAQMLAMRPFRGRMHCSYNLVGSETGRITSSKSILIADEYEW
jgi:uracil-DNA glycosylase family 4